MNEPERGFELEKQFLSPATVLKLLKEIALIEEAMLSQETVLSNNQKSLHGIRNVEKKFKSIAELVQSKKLLAKAESVLGNKPQFVRAIFFDKTPDKNWLVSWHQDKTIAVSKKRHIDGWGPWSVKDNTHHVQPGERVLNEMVTFRIHLDDTNVDNGCLKVIPNSHTSGVLTQEEINKIVKETKFVECEAQAGDMLIMRPLILHASGKAKSPNHRRVIHLEFSGYELPDGLNWA